MNYTIMDFSFLQIKEGCHLKDKSGLVLNNLKVKSGLLPS
jgi:hypothetical protein